MTNNFITQGKLLQINSRLESNRWNESEIKEEARRLGEEIKAKVNVRDYVNSARDMWHKGEISRCVYYGFVDGLGY